MSARRRALIRTVAAVSFCLGFFLCGRILSGTSRNALSVVAAVLCLPAGLSIVNLIMLCRARPCSAQAYRKIEAARGGLTVLYDLTLTSGQGDYPVAAACAIGDRILCYTEDEKVRIPDLTHHIEMQMSLGKYHGKRIEVERDTDAFCDGLRMLDAQRASAGVNQTAEEAAWQPGTPQTMLGVLRSISL